MSAKLLRFRCEIINDEPYYFVDGRTDKGEIETKEVHLDYILRLISVIVDYQAKKRMRQYFESIVGRG